MSLPNRATFDEEEAMGKAVDSYLFQNCFLRRKQINGRRKKIVDRVAKMFGLLNDNQVNRLEQGDLLTTEDLTTLANKAEETFETVRQDLSNFLFWLSR